MVKPLGSITVELFTIYSTPLGFWNLHGPPWAMDNVATGSLDLIGPQPNSGPEKIDRNGPNGPKLLYKTVLSNRVSKIRISVYLL